MRKFRIEKRKFSDKEGKKTKKNSVKDFELKLISCYLIWITHSSVVVNLPSLSE